MSKDTELKVKKRKSAPEPAVATKKTKVAPTEEAPKLKSALRRTASRTIVKDAPESVAEKPARKTRKRAEDLIEPEQPQTETVVEKAPGKAKKTKTTTTVTPTETGAVEVKKTVTTEKKEKSKALKPSKAVQAPEPVENDASASDDEEEEPTVDDQTAALLAGFESSEDENDPQDEGIALDKVPAIPDNAQLQKQIKEAQQDSDSTPGVLYVGRIPHGFYEHQMRAYFSQFGEITHLRISRNKLTGHSKHYAFIEFASNAVADIVAKTMDKYLMFNHILQVRRIPTEQVHANLWKGEGKRFKAMPRNKIEGGMLRRGTTREGWEKRVKTEEKRRTKKSKQLEEMGYEFQMPSLKSVSDVPVKEIEDAGVAVIADGDEIKVLEAKASEGPSSEAQAAAVEEVPEVVAPAETTPVKRKKGTKASKKTKKVKT